MTEQVVIVTPNGVARLESERVRIDAIKAAGKFSRAYYY